MYYMYYTYKRPKNGLGRILDSLYVHWYSRPNRSTFEIHKYLHARKILIFKTLKGQSTGFKPVENYSRQLVSNSSSTLGTRFMKSKLFGSTLN